MDLLRRTSVAGPWRWPRLLMLAAAPWTGECVAESYAILSLVGDRITVIGEQQQTGTRLDQGQRQILQLPHAGLDDYAARIAYATISKARPTATVDAYRAKDPALYKLRDSWLDTDTIEVRELLTTLADLIPPSPDGHLLLIAPYRDRLELRTTHDYLGSAKVSGLGFYLDWTTPLRSVETGTSGLGFLGTFANFQLVLINLQSKAIEAQKRVVVGGTVAAARAKDRTPWNALSPAGKITALESYLKREIERELPAMLGTQKP